MKRLLKTKHFKRKLTYETSRERELLEAYDSVAWLAVKYCKEKDAAIKKLKRIRKLTEDQPHSGEGE